MKKGIAQNCIKIALRQFYSGRRFEGRRENNSFVWKKDFSYPKKANKTPTVIEVLSLMNKMPKAEPAHLRGLKQQRADKKKQLSGQISHNASFQVLGNCKSDGLRTLCLVTDFNRYLFNVSEGTQRATADQGPSKAMSQLTDVFITRKCWQNLGGFPGVCLTSRDMGSNEVNLHGPPGCMDLFKSTRDFILLHNFEVTPTDVLNGPPHEDGTVKIETVNVAYAGPKTFPGKPKYSEWQPLTANEFKGGFKTRTAPYEIGKARQNIVLSYIVTIKAKVGKLQVAKCLEAGVPPGPMLGDLKKGKSVTLACGKVVHAKDVLEECEPPIRSFVVDCPTTDYIDGLVDNERLRQKEGDNPTSYVFHMTPANIVKEEKYQKWMKAFPDTVKHVLINEGCRDYAGDSMFRLVRQLHAMAPGMFPKMLHKAEESKEELAKNVIFARGGANYFVRPEICIDESHIPTNCETTWTEVDEDTKEEERVRDELAKVKEIPLDTTKPEFPIVTFLGTGSSIPSKYRNVTSILIETERDRFFLLDCGEGTLNQIYRHFGPDKAKNVLLNLKAVFNSHYHADHHLGLINIILARTRLFKSQDRKVDKLYLMTSGKLAIFMRYYHEAIESILEDLVHVRLEHFLLTSAGGMGDVESKFPKTQMIDPKFLDEMQRCLGLSSLVTQRAHHCPHAFSISLTTSAGSGYKVVFSGDTRPCDWLKELCAYERPPDLLIHEATLEHYLLYDAKKKMHSTFTEAVQGGKDMNAAFTILTHFSQRYSKLPPLDEFRDEAGVGIAFDHLRVTPQTLGHIRPMYPVLESVFVKAVEQMAERKERGLTSGEFNPLNMVPTRKNKSKRIAAELMQPGKAKIAKSIFTE